MVDYRLYVMTPDGHIRQAIDLECDDDAEAIAVAERHAETGPVELWQRDRRVKVFAAKVAE